MGTMRLASSCAGVPDCLVAREGGLNDMIGRSLPISRRTFRKHVFIPDLLELEREMGYASHPKKGLTAASDPFVTYHRSKLFGRVVYYLRWSRIEYIFTPDGKLR